MTTTIRIDAHCASDVEVVIKMRTGPVSETVTRIQNQESHTCYVYADMTVTVQEVKKENV